MKLSIVIPAHNEEKRIADTLEDYGGFFGEKYGRNIEIIAVLNGCTDGTLRVVKRFEKKYPCLRHLDFKKLGKGFAVIEGFKAANGELIGFVDADNATTALEFNKLIENIKGFDGTIGSRWLKGSMVIPKQPLARRIAGRGFNLLNRILFGLRFKDTQCGAKLFTKKAAKAVTPRLGITEWAFDADLLYEMKIGGFRVKEVAIRWQDVKGSKLNIMKTPLRMFLSLIRLRLIYSPFKFMVKFYDQSLPEWIKVHHNLK